MTTAAAPVMSLSEQIGTLMTMLFGGCTGAVPVVTATIHGVGRGQRLLTMADALRGGIPSALLDPLEQHQAVLVALAPRPALAIGALVATFPIAGSEAAGPGGRELLVRQHQETVRMALSRFALAPGAVVDALHQVIVVWPLAEPLEKPLPVLRALAEKLGTQVPETVTDMWVPLPGSVIRNAGAHPPRVMVEFTSDPTRRYNVHHVEAALGGRR